MTTPKKYINNLKNGIITIEMLEMGAKSANVRAKHYRDAARRSYGFYKKAKYDEMNKYYNLKKEFLTLMQPTCIHCENHNGCNTTNRYYLYYKMSTYSFHTPIAEGKVKEYCEKYNCEVEEIDTIVYRRNDVTDVLSAQFIEKMAEAIRQNKVKLVEEKSN